MQGIELRPETEADLGFLKDLYASSREPEMAMLVNWTGEQKREFLEMQFNAQRGHYRQHYPDARYDVIERDGTAIGRLYVAEQSRELILMDITLMPESRNSGIGTQLCGAVMNEAAQKGKIVSLHVEDENPARRLYDRLGFVEVGEVTFYKLMHWVPEGLEQLGDEIVAERAS